MDKILEKIRQSPIVPVYYHDDIVECKRVLDICYAGGIRVFEFVNRGSKALENFSKLLIYSREKYIDLFIGIGTVKTAVQAKAFIELGCDFIVSPIFNVEIAQLSKLNDVLWVPGCMTPTEIFMAENEGIDFVKLFPGDVLGPTFIKAIKPLFPNMHFMVTGGVSLSAQNLSDWFDVGVQAVGVGSNLFKGEFRESSDVIGNLSDAISFIRDRK